MTREKTLVVYLMAGPETPELVEVAVACVGGGSNAIGLFAGFVEDAEVRLIGVEAAGAASLSSGRPGVLHGARSSLLVDEDGQVLDPEGEPVPGLFAAGDVVAGQRNLIATAFGLGQNAGLAASDLMREW